MAKKNPPEAKGLNVAALQKNSSKVDAFKPSDPKKSAQSDSGNVLSNPNVQDGGVPEAAPTQTRTPIGVPATGAPRPGYTPGGATTQAGANWGATPDQFYSIQYYRGDELIGRNWGAEQIIDWQNRLVQMGLLARNQYQVGVWDDKTAEAYSQLLGYANSTGKDYNAAANELLARVQQYGDTTLGSRAPFVAQLTRPETLMSMAKELSARVMDRQLTDEEAMRYATAFNDLERASQQDFYNAQGTATNPGPGGDVYSPGSFSDYTQAQLEKDPAMQSSIAGARLIHTADAFYDLLNSSRARYNQAVQ